MAATPSDKILPSVLTPGMVASRQHGSESLERTAEISQAGVAAHMQAAVQAKYVMAERRPRDEDDVRAKLMRDCQRPSFASMAMYRVPRAGGVVTGLSIRFAEAAIRAMGNAWCETFSIYDDQQKRIVRVRVVDLENNTTHERDVTIDKLVERSRPDAKRGHEGQRVNSQGQVVFIVRPSEDDFANKERALTSKAMRTLILRLVPVWLQEECREELSRTLQNDAASDPDAAKKRILDKFGELNVMPSSIAEFLGHNVDVCSPAELADLRGIFQAVRDGEASWPELVAARKAERGEAAKPGDDSAAPGTKPSTRAEEVLNRLSKKEK